MRTGLKKLAVPSAAALLALSMCIPALAAEDRKKITTVKITISGDEPVADEDIGSVSASVSDSAYYTVDDSAFTKDDETWDRGTTPVVRVELTAKDGYYFSSMSKSNVSVSGMHGEYKSSKSVDNGSGLQVDIKLRKVAGDLSDIDDIYWDGKSAVWEEINDADKYEVKLYRGTRTVTTVTTTGHKYDFYPYMTSSGEYSFKVRAVSNTDGETSSWTDLSDEFYMSSGNVYTGSAPGSSGTGGSVGPAGTSGANASGGVWYDSVYGWWYRMADGNPVKNSWLYVDNNWFRLDANGFMLTGLQSIDGFIYYLNPVSDGTRGAMLTGLQNVGGAICYFSPSADASRGILLTGYQQVNGLWYYFDTTNGAMWANRVSPNGRWLNEAGVMQ